VRDGFTPPRPTGDLKSKAVPSTPCLDRGTACILCETGRPHGSPPHSQYPLASTVAARTASRDRHAQSPPQSSAVALVPSPCLHHHSFSSSIHFSIPSSLDVLSPFSIPVRCCAPRAPLSPLCFFFGRILEERGPPPRRRVRARPRPTAPPGDRVFVKPRAVPLLLGPPAGVLEWPPRRVGGLHCAFSLVTPPVGARVTVTNRPIGRVGLGGAAGCVPFSGANRWLCKSPAREAGRLDCLIFARRPACGCVRNLCRLPTRELALLWYRGLCP